MGSFADKFTRAAGAATGFVLVAALIVAARPAGGEGGVLPASIRFLGLGDGAVALSPAAPRPLLLSGPLRPGDGASGSVVVRNQTGATLAVRLRAHPDSTALDGLARVRLQTAGETLFDGTLQALREGTPVPLRLGPGAERRLRVTATLPAAVETGYEGRRVDVNLEPSEEPAP